ncbi:hypothetical protein RvY_13805-2 [Ramazzottius varieornatus]|nr:hypothetical protein RvY_13805-2 [Ramazzottius varieornatus]
MLDNVWAIRVTAVCCLIVLTWLNVFGIKWIIRAQYVIVIILSLGVGDFFVGSLYQEIPEYGVERPSAEIFKENLYVQYDNWHGFWKNLGLYFPSVAGVLVGFNIARDLRDPQRSIPKGTFAAMLCGMSVHIMFILMLGACVLRSYLVEHPHITIRMAALHVFIIIAVSISAGAVGMGAIFNASRVLARVAKDTSIRGVKQLDWMWDRFQTPVFSILVVFLTSLLFVLIGHINFLAPIITTSHLMTFSAINYAYFALSTTYKLQVKRDYKATTEWLQQGLREGRIASPDSRHQSPKFPRSPEQHETMSHSSSVTSERSHLLGSGSAGHTPKEALLPPLIVASQVLSKPGDTLLRFHNRWVALAASVIMIVIAFLIQWESALSAISTLGLIYISVSYLTPRPTAGIVEFRPVDWIVSKFTGETYNDLETETLQTVSTAGAPEESRFIRSLGSPHLPTSSSAPFLSG